LPLKTSAKNLYPNTTLHPAFGLPSISVRLAFDQTMIKNENKPHALGV